MTTPYTAEILAPSLARGRCARPPAGEIARSRTGHYGSASFVPQEQEPKLAMLGDLPPLISPTLAPEATLPPPTDAEIATSMTDLRKALRPVVSYGADAGGRTPAARLSQALAGAATRVPAIIPALEKDLLAGLEQRLDMLRGIIDVQPVTIDSLPPQLRDT